MEKISEIELESDDNESNSSSGSNNSRMTWNEDVETTVKTIGEKSKGYKIMHFAAVRRSTRCYKWLMYLGMVTGPLAGVISSIGSALNPNGPNTFDIISTVISFISGMFISAVKFGKFDQKSNSHRTAVAKYTSLESNVRIQLGLYRNRRIKAYKYIKWLSEKFDELFLSSPLIDQNIYNHYIKNAKKIGLTLPDEYGITIKINEEYEKKKNSDLTNHTEIKINTQYKRKKHASKKQPSASRNGLPAPKVYSPKNQLEPSLKGTKIIPRTCTFSNFSGLNKYDIRKMF